MTITRSEGCTAFWTKIDGKDANEMTPEQLDKALTTLFARIRSEVKANSVSLNSILNLIEPDETEDRGRCEQCDDTVTLETWSLEESA